MADIDRLANMREEVLKRLVIAIEMNRDDLEIAMNAARLNAVAWLTRNILELTFWSAYCAQSETNAKEFVLESARDAHDALDIPDGMLSHTFSFKDSRDKLIDEAKQDGFETLDDHYKSVLKIAKLLGKGAEFKALNKILSKYAHPTALSVINYSEHNDTFRRKFYEIGCWLTGQALNSLKQRN